MKTYGRPYGTSSYNADKGRQYTSVHNIETQDEIHDETQETGNQDFGLKDSLYTVPDVNNETPHSKWMETVFN